LHATHSAPGNGSRDGASITTPVLPYAALAGASDDSTVEPAPFSPTNTTIRKGILVNERGERLDRFLKMPPQAAFANYHSKKRELEATGKRGPCNLHYLGGGCPMQASICQFWHKGFEKAHISVMEWFMRFQRCDKGLQCRLAWCFYGHACLGSCKQPCKFGSEMHHVKRNGEREILGE